VKILVYRLSAMGDVALLLPILKGVLNANKDVEIYFLTKPAFYPLFQNIERLYLVKPDFHGKHKVIAGLFWQYKKIKSEINPELVIDVHKVIRSYLLDLLFAGSGYRVILFDKGKKEKKQLIKTKLLKKLPDTIERYSAAFLKAGLKIDLPDPPLFQNILKADDFVRVFHYIPSKQCLIGIAPFARHRPKIWGISKIEKLIERINLSFDAVIILFGGGEEEIQRLNELARIYENCIVSANHFKLDQEMKLFSLLHVMVSMDSANMHLASMAGVPTISIWGATHPALGFAPYHQPPENIVQYEGDQLTCRPCSVYGNKKCIFSEIKCMEYISVDSVFKRVSKILSNLHDETIE